MPSAGRHTLRAIGRGRFKRSIFGYRPREVEEALAFREAELEARDAEVEAQGSRLREREEAVAARDGRIDELDKVARYLAARVVQRQRELRALREELEELRAKGGGEPLAEVERQVEEIRSQARGQATRIRMQALRQAVELARRSVEGGPGARDGRSAAGSAYVPADSNGYAEGRAVDLFEGLIHVEIGPLADFSQLVGFEDAANEIGASSVSVERFSGGRATLAMRLEHPVELLRELEERAPLEFRVRSLKDDRLILDVEEREAA